MTAAAPTPSHRLPAIDALRGVAILGILLMNITSFAMPYPAYVDPHTYGDNTGLNALIYRVEHVLVAGKFLALLSILFGAGIVLRDVPRAWLHVRRMLVLGVMGLLHAYLLWYGDILFAYALVGLMVFFLRRLQGAALLAIGAALILLVALVLGGMTTAAYHLMDHDDRTGSIWIDGEVDDELAAYRGSYAQQFPQRSRTAFDANTAELVFIGPGIAGLMLLGMGLTKLGFLTGQLRPRTYVLIAVACGLPAVAGSIFTLQLAERWAHMPFVRSSIALIPNGPLAALMAVAYASILLPIAMRWSPAPLVAIGRTALSCYLLQTLICTTIFYGHGLGWFGYVDRAQQLLVVVGVWLFLLIAAPLWLRRFRIGPFEWVWRRLAG